MSIRSYSFPDFETYDGSDDNGPYREFYAENNDGAAFVQRWYLGSKYTFDDAPTAPCPRSWVPLSQHDDGPDRTDPGYWQDNF